VTGVRCCPCLRSRTNGERRCLQTLELRVKVVRDFLELRVGQPHRIVFFRVRASGSAVRLPNDLRAVGATTKELFAVTRHIGCAMLVAGHKGEEPKYQDTTGNCRRDFKPLADWEDAHADRWDSQVWQWLQLTAVPRASTDWCFAAHDPALYADRGADSTPDPETGQIRRAAFDEQVNQVSCLNLVANAVVAWNTVYMGAVVERLRLEGHTINDADVGHLSPARFEHINPYGKYRFDVALARRSAQRRPLRRP